jgi:hypothetical protein
MLKIEFLKATEEIRLITGQQPILTILKSQLLDLKFVKECL